MTGNVEMEIRSAGRSSKDGSATCKPVRGLILMGIAVAVGAACLDICVGMEVLTAVAEEDGVDVASTVVQLPKRSDRITMI